MERLWVFEPLDTLFFRDGRPFNAGENQATESAFPPTGFTLVGAIRAAILQSQGLDPAEYGRATVAGTLMGRVAELYPILGDANTPGHLRMAGPYLISDRGELLYPAPLDLLRLRDSGTLTVLQPGDPVPCDLGVVRLPEFSQPGSRVQTLAGRWVTASALEAVLAGEVAAVPPGTIFEAVGEGRHGNVLARRERRIGLARNTASRTATEGLLYSTAHVRLADGVQVAARVDMPPEWVPRHPILARLGGEGRHTVVSVTDAPRWPAMPPLRSEGGRVRFKLVLTTPGRFGGSWLPPGLVRDADGGATVWRGALHGVPVAVVSACVGKAQRVGGWDLARGKPRPLVACVPAGSVYFCESDAPPALVSRLHGAHLGDDTAYGFGHVLVGTW